MVKRGAGKKQRTAGLSNSAKRLAALKHEQQIDAILKGSSIQTQAIVDSAGEDKPVNESHALSLLEEEPESLSVSSSHTRAKPSRKSARRR